jgi:hypothetical protein
MNDNFAVTEKFQNFEFNYNGTYRKKDSQHWVLPRNKRTRSTNGKMYSYQEAFWIAFHGEIPPNHFVKNISNNKTDCNVAKLELVRKENVVNNLASLAHRAHQMRRHVSATNLTTGEVIVFRSKNNAGKYFGVSAGSIHYFMHKSPNQLHDNIHLEATDNPVTYIKI